MSLFYYAILAALQAGEKPDEIVSQLNSQGKDNPRMIAESLIKDMVWMVRKEMLRNKEIA